MSIVNSFKHITVKLIISQIALAVHSSVFNFKQTDDQGADWDLVIAIHISSLQHGHFVNQ